MYCNRVTKSGGVLLYVCLFIESTCVQKLRLPASGSSGPSDDSTCSDPVQVTRSPVLPVKSSHPTC